MATNTLPIDFMEILSLTSIGVQPTAIGFKSLTMESDRFICVRDKVNNANQVVIIDLHDGNSVLRRPITADSAMMHPSEKIVALKSQRQLQVFNLALKTKLKSHVMSEDVVFWKWVDAGQIGLVTDTAVYHWSLEADTDQPTKVFDRQPNLQGAQIINYRVDKDDKWMVLVGITQDESGRIKGAMQLYSRERSVSQPIEGHAAAFAHTRLDGATSDTKLFTFSVRTEAGAKLHIVEIDHNPNNPVFQKKQVDVYFRPDAINDFPVALQVSQRYRIIFLITKYGFFHLYDLDTGVCIYMNRISLESVFVTAEQPSTGGVLVVNRKGQVFRITISEVMIIPYILNTLNNTTLAVDLASRANLPGADDLYVQQFTQLVNAGNHSEAAKIAANSPRGILRTPETIESFKLVPAQPGQLTPILQYFGILLDKGGLNHHETLELAKPVLAQNRINLLQKWFNEGKLSCSEELGNLVRPHDLQLALGIYLQANVPQKVVACYAELGDFEKIVPYANQAGYQPDYAGLLQHIVRINTERGVEFAAQLASIEGGSLIDIDRVVDVFMSQNMVQQATAFLLDVLKDNRPDQADQQTRLLEINLTHAPQVADAILGNDMFSYYDRPKIARLCEKAGLYQRALEHYDDINDIKTVIKQAHNLNSDWIVTYFGRLSVEQSLECLHTMLETNLTQNLQIVLLIATKYSDILGPLRLIELFEQFKTPEGLYFYLGSIVNISDNPDVTFKYIQAACQIGQFKEIERVCRESNYYNPEKVKNFLKERRLTDQLPLIIVCDRFNFVHDLVLYLYQNSLFKFIEVYVQSVNPSQTPAVVGALLDVDCDDSIIKSLLMTVSGQVPIGELVREVESRNRLKILMPYLEQALQHGSQDPALYNALAKIYIDSNNNPEKFLLDNSLYDSLVVGKYCEKRNPYLAFICYEKGQNDMELINVTNENSMFKHQARYLVKRRNSNLWDTVLSDDNMYRRDVVDHVIAVAVPETKDPEDVSIAVKAFMDADLPKEMIELLERIILEPTAFSENQNLQNLLILTAVKADKPKVTNYIRKLEHYDAEDMADITIDAGLYEEAFEIYKKHNMHAKAINILVEHIASIDRAAQYSEKVDIPQVWSRLAKAQLDGLRIADAVDSYIRAKDPSNYAEVIQMADQAGQHEELIKFLQMARITVREPAVDGGLLLSFAKTNRLQDMKQFLASVNSADVHKIGDLVLEAGNYEAAKILFSSISAWARLATTLIHLGDYQNAVDCARKANNAQVWKQVNQVCIEKKEFRLAQICGLNLVIHAEEMQDVIKQYESKGYFEELIKLLEAAMSSERAHMALFTELSIVYVKYAPERVMEHLKLFWSRINIAKVIRACEEAHLWVELVFLYMHYDEFDNAVLAMMAHPTEAWEHSSFKENIGKVSNLEIYYKALKFYLEQQPTLLTDLLSALTPRIDHARVVRMFEKSDNIPLIRSYLVAVQHKNIDVVNNALNELYIEEEDYKSLQDSVSNYSNFDALALAKRLEKHDLLEIRRIAAQLWIRNKRYYQHAIDLLLGDQLYKDAIDIAQQSNDSEVAMHLLQYFVDTGNREAFAAMLYVCYDILRADQVLELAWKAKFTDYAMPFFINTMSEQAKRLSILEQTVAELQKSAVASKTGGGGEDNPETSVLGNQRLIGYGANGRV